MRVQLYILVGLILMAVLISLGGCLANRPSLVVIDKTPSIFYQAYDGANEDSPAPFFLTIEEAQEYCDRINKETEGFTDMHEYHVRFIAR